jgi:hypothetical protein
MSNTKVVMSQASNQYVAPTFIEDVFSTYLYTGNSSTQTITNGIDLAGEGGLVWGKNRTSGITSGHYLTDTERGINSVLYTERTDAAVTFDPNLSSFNSNGFTLNNNSNLNFNGRKYASWTFRKAPRFFDCVEYTGTGSARTISHNLGTTPGCIIIKCTTNAHAWVVYHRSLGTAQHIALNTTNPTSPDSSGEYWNSTTPTSEEFSLGTYFAVNGVGREFVAYLYAHDPLGPSEDGSDGLISCGSYTGNGSASGPEIDLGWEPQWLLVKRSSGTDDWYLFDTMRGFTVQSDFPLSPNTNNAESTAVTLVNPTSTGFSLTSSNQAVNASGNTYIYIAIRRGPMRAPESGTEVFAIDTQGSTGDGNPPAFRSTFPVDIALRSETTVSGRTLSARLTGTGTILTNSTNAEVANDQTTWDFQNGMRNTGSTYSLGYAWMWKRAPNFFDVVAYTGNNTTQTVSHNLGVPPELIIVKSRSTTGNWRTLSTSLSQYTNLNTTGAFTGTFVETVFGNNTVYVAPTETQFTLGSDDSVNNGSSTTYIAYLFATLAGVSKVGSYTGNGSSQTINCGFTTGARFILIKRTDSTGDWYVWDTARGIVTGNDPHLSLNNNAAQVTTDDSIDPASSGFIVNQVAATNINVSSASYIFYAIA